MPARANFSRDVASAYLASISRVLSWVIISAIVFRRSTEAFALLALVRGTLGILNYVSLGLLPAMIRAFAVESARTAVPVVAVSEDAPAPALAYATPSTTIEDRGRQRKHFDTSPLQSVL